jgi:cyclophilin family peptidyl-prolyl cis-trans isomerase
MPWEVFLLPRPHLRDVDNFERAVKQLGISSSSGLPYEIALAKKPLNLSQLHTSLNDFNGDIAPLWTQIAESILVLSPSLSDAITTYSQPKIQILEYLNDAMITDIESLMHGLAERLGTGNRPMNLPIYLSPFVPFPMQTPYLTSNGAIRAAIVDYRRAPGPALIESVVTVVAEMQLRTQSTENELSRLFQLNLTDEGPSTRTLIKTACHFLTSLTIESLVKEIEPSYSGIVSQHGTDLSFSRIFDAVHDPWQDYLEKRIDRVSALSFIFQQLNRYPHTWYLMEVEAASVAADFYVLEYLSSIGCKEASRLFDDWEPILTSEVVHLLDVAIGAELTHYDGVDSDVYGTELREFVRNVCDSNSMINWPIRRRTLGYKAYELASLAFAGPGAEYGGDAWAPVATLMKDFHFGRISSRIFLDQSFSLEHNNGCIFDMYQDVSGMPDVLDAQARGSVHEISEYASAEVRRIFTHCELMDAAHDGQLLRTPIIVDEHGNSDLVDKNSAPLNEMTRCGSGLKGTSVTLEAVRSMDRQVEASRRSFDRQRRPRRLPFQVHSTAVVALHSTLGSIVIHLSPLEAPMATGIFIQLALGEIPWRDPLTGSAGIGRFYDHTRFYRTVPGTLLQGGDRTETGRRGAGFRYDREITPSMDFRDPFLFAMSNTGTRTNNSQFFITLVPLEHLTGNFTVFGRIEESASREVARNISFQEPRDVEIVSVEIVELSSAVDVNS